MEKLRLADGMEMEISEGSDLRNITTGLKSYAELDGLAGKLTRENLTRVQFLTDEEAATVSGLYPEWKPDTRYQTGERAAYQDMLYRARQDHTSDGQYPPDTVPALWDMIPLAE